jgi:hypothetical protein
MSSVEAYQHETDGKGSPTMLGRDASIQQVNLSVDYNMSQALLPSTNALNATTQSEE